MRTREGIAPLCAFLLTFLAFITYPKQAAARSVRTAEVDDGGVTVVKTAIGFSTILEFQNKPISAVLGDQDSFKLEYVGNSITLKPLVPHAKSNLFVFTEFERFNCQIVTVPQLQVDYIVKIRTKVKAYPLVGGPEAQPTIAGPALAVRKLGRSASYAGFKLTLISTSRERGAQSPRAVTLIDFALSSSKASYDFQAASLGIRQSGKYLNIESIYLDSLHLEPGTPAVRGKIALLSQDFNPQLPVAVVFAVPASKGPGAHRIEVSTATVSKPTAQEGNKTDEKGK